MSPQPAGKPVVFSVASKLLGGADLPEAGDVPRHGPIEYDFNRGEIKPVCGSGQRGRNKKFLGQNPDHRHCRHPQRACAASERDVRRVRY